MKKSVVAAGLTAGLLAGAGVAYALESSNDPAAAPAAQVVSINSDTSGTESATGTVNGDRETMLRETLQPLVDDGTLTAAQLDKVVAALVASGPGVGHGDGDGDMGRGGPGMGLQTVADVLGLTVDEVRTAIQSGTTLADLAEQNDKTAQDLIDALVDEAKAHLDEEVAAGTHTQDEADTLLAEATTRITEFVNNTQAMAADGGPMGGGRGHGPGGEGGMGGMGGTGGGTIDAGPTDDTTNG
jgi:hypothetical protein